MHVTSITQQNGAQNDGLAPISMRGLKRIVVLAGANGSGKTRFLTRVTHGANPGNARSTWGAGFKLENPIANAAPVPFVSKQLTLQDPAAQTRQKAAKWAEQAESPGAAHLSHATLAHIQRCLLYTSPSPRDGLLSRMPSSA